MKQSLVRFFNNPKHVAILALIIAIPVGVFGYLRINRVPTYSFVHVWEEQQTEHSL